MIIPLTNSSAFAIVNDIDASRVLQYKWFLKYGRGNKYYPAMSKRENKRVKTIWLHRFIMDAQKGQDVHHKDNNALNNTRENLECLKHSQHSVLTNGPASYQYEKYCKDMGYI